MAYIFITPRQIGGGKMETVTDFIFLGSKIIVDGDCSHEIKRHLLLGRKAVTNLMCVSHSVMSDSLQPHGLQPASLLCPWNSPGKNTGVGYHFLLQCMKAKVKSLSRVQLLVTPWTAAYQAPR